MTTQADIKIESNGAASAALSALTPEQALLIKTGARSVPRRWHPRFFEVVAARLSLVSSPTCHDISEICIAARRSIAVGISPPSVEDW